MAKQFYFFFGSGNPGSYTGLSPTFTIFNQNGNTALPAPGITEFVNAGATGIYGFQYGATSSVVFLIDGGATLTTASVRYIVGNLDPVLAIDQSIGYATDSIGTTTTDPSTIYGQLKRNQEFNEGAKVFTKATALWDVYSRGSSILLFEKTLTNTSTTATSN